MLWDARAPRIKPAPFFLPSRGPAESPYRPTWSEHWPSAQLRPRRPPSVELDALLRHDLPQLNKFEVPAFDPLQGREFLVVPTRVGCPGHEPVPAIVSHQHPVLLQRGQNDPGHRWEARDVITRFQPDAHAHRREAGVDER